MQRFMLGAYWGARRENLEECAEKANRFFDGLVQIDPLLAHWYERGRSRGDALQRRVDPLDTEKLRFLLLKGRNRRDVDREVIEDLGFRIGLWNGADAEDDRASVDIHCGSYTPLVGNEVVINLPHRSQGHQWVTKASALLALVADVWRPDWAGIMSDKAMRARDFDGDHPFVDWMVYVPRLVESVPPPSSIEAVNGLGSIIVVQPEPTTGNDSEELSRVRQVERLLAA